MSLYAEQLASAVRATRLSGAGDVFWFERRLTRPLPPRFTRLMPGAARDCRVTALQDRLYADFYCRGTAAPTERGPADVRVAADATQLFTALSAANAGVGYLDSTWEIRRAGSTALIITQNGVDVIACASDCELPPDTAMAEGVRVGVRFPKELTGRLPGFYVACGDRPLRDTDFRALLRIYWNVTPRGAVELMRVATSLLNGAGIAFQLKVHGDLAHASRADAAVLYVSRSTYPQTVEVVQRIYAEVAVHLGRAVPALTKMLAPGVGLAEDPGGGASFGQHRCGLLAAALVDAHEERRLSSAARLDLVAERLASNGVPLNSPYLNTGSDDIYDCSFDVPVIAAQRAVDTRQRRVLSDDCLVTAERIAECLCRDALWSGGQCSWMGAGSGAHSGISYESLRAPLYAGTSGIALFLAELAAVTGDLVARRTALGAIRHALARVDAVPVQERLGLFSGWMGIALASARVGILTGDESLAACATDLLRRIDLYDAKTDSSDVISGAAGAIIGLLACRPLLGDVALYRAIDLADALLVSAAKVADHWSWQSLNRPGELNLTGFSHGAAGIGWSLFELYRVCRDSRYQAAADMAFAYERRWFDINAQNWRDLRGYPVRGTRRDDPVPCSAYWCHGAPGIALSRLRAFQITGDPRHKADAVAALQTTASATERALNGAMNFSLCHGVAGNADVLMSGDLVLGGELPQASSVALLVAACGIERHAATEDWPSGAHASTPALMIGLAGVGHFYLRLACPATPSVLLIDVDAWFDSDAHVVSPSAPVDSAETGAMAATR